jgi:spore germination cell wall hydrolase CwlJ-like protein
MNKNLRTSILITEKIETPTLKSMLSKLLLLLSLIFVTILQSKGSEHRIVAQTILAEARGDGRAGMYAVAACIKVRAQKRNLSFKQVCLQPYQFSCWNKNDPNRKKMAMLLTLPQAEYAWQLARNMDKVKTEAINKADHYMTVKLWKTGRVKWARGQKPVAFWGSHVFFRLR